MIILELEGDNVNIWNVKTEAQRSEVTLPKSLCL